MLILDQLIFKQISDCQFSQQNLHIGHSLILIMQFVASIVNCEHLT